MSQLCTSGGQRTGVSASASFLPKKSQADLLQNGLVGKDSDAGRDWGQEEKGMTEDEMAGWHH